jgi:hypothetical protein
MTQDQQGRWRMGPREWIAFASLLLAIITHGVIVVVWVARLGAEVAAARPILQRLDDKREEGAALVQRVNDHDRRITNLEQRAIP